jgi:hypothetical protein
MHLRSRSFEIPVVVAALLAFATPSAFPQKDEPEEARLVVRHDGDSIALSAKDGPIALDELVARWSETTGRAFVYGARLHDGPVVRLVGESRAPRADADFLFESILLRAGYGLLPSGPPEARTYSIEHAAESRSPRADAPFVDPKDLDAYAKRPAQIVSTVFRVKNVSAHALRSGLQRRSSPLNIESLDVAGDEDALAATGAAAALLGLRATVEAAERAAAEAFETGRIELRFAIATEIAPILRAVVVRRNFDAVVPHPPGAPSRSDRGSVAADARTNSVVYDLCSADVEILKALVAALDVEVAPAPKKPATPEGK